jgi:flagellin-like protein
MIRTDRSDDRGQVGIGTLIIFIAMVLVAAVAAGVLVNTAGLLQSKASDTGEDAQSQVSNQIDVVGATGHVDGSGNVEDVTLVVKKSPGSGDIDLAEATIQYVSSGESVTLQHAATASGTEFSTSGVRDTGSADVLEDTDERIEITVSPSDIETSPAGLAEGEEVTLRVVDQSGATTTYGVNVPDTIGSSTYVEV